LGHHGASRSDETYSTRDVLDLYRLRWRIDIDQAWRLSRFCGWGGVVVDGFSKEGLLENEWAILAAQGGERSGRQGLSAS